MKKMNIKKTVIGVVLASMLALPTAAFSADFHIAVASNFDACLGDLISEYNDNVNPTISITKTHNSSGILDSEIRADSTTYQLFLSADAGRPAALVTDGLGSNSQTYAEGILVSFSLTESNHANFYSTGAYPVGPPATVAVADPSLAPYGKATKEAFANKGNLNLYNPNNSAWASNSYFNPAIFDATNTNIGTTLGAVLNGSMDIGFVAKGQVVKSYSTNEYTPVPSSDYSPIIQKGCVIKQGGVGGSVDQDVADFFDWLLNDSDARAIIAGYGYN